MAVGAMASAAAVAPVLVQGAASAWLSTSTRLGALEPLSAFLATVLISRHGLTIMTQGAGHAECAAVARFAKSHIAYRDCCSGCLVLHAANLRLIVGNEKPTTGRPQVIAWRRRHSRRQVNASPISARESAGLFELAWIELPIDELPRRLYLLLA